MSDPPALPPSPPAPQPPSRTGRLVVGLLLVLLGVGWLLDVLDVMQLAWGVVLPSALIVIGVALLLTSRAPEAHGGLIAAGVVLTVVLALGSALDVPVGGGVGDREFHPTTAGAIKGEYELGIGQLMLDLSDLTSTDFLAAEIHRVRAKVGVGELIVIVPVDLDVRVQAHAGLGDVRIFDTEASGFDVDRTVSATGPSSEVLDLVVSVGVGQVEVRRG